jgi:hypothetical protein
MAYGFVSCRRLTAPAQAVMVGPQLFKMLLNRWKQLIGGAVTYFDFARLRRRLPSRSRPPLSPPSSLFPIGCRRLKAAHNTCSKGVRNLR